MPPAAPPIAATPALPEIGYRRWIAFAVLVAAGVALLVRAYASGAFRLEVNWSPGEQTRMWQIFGAAMLAGTALAIARPRKAHRGLSLLLLALVLAVFGPGAVAAVAALAITASVIGARIARGFGLERADALVALCVGAVAIAAVIGATAAWRIHYAFVYALAALACVALLRGEIAPLALAWSAWWAPRPLATTRRAGLPLALLAGTLAVHTFIAAKPEVGNDALTMHLQIATEMAHRHHFAQDVVTHIWAVMPIGIDYLYSVAFLFAGESAAKLANLGMFAALLAFIVRIAGNGDRGARGSALVAAALFASMPLAYTETSSLFIENGWAALLLGATATADRAIRERSLAWGMTALWLAAGSLQAKVIGVFWVVPLAIALAVALRGRLRTLSSGQWMLLGAAAAIAGWPYVNALARTGNPVFPFFNTFFGSPFYKTDTPFNNYLYNTPLTWSAWYDIVVDTRRYLEGDNGALGIHWIVLFPALFVLVRRAQLRAVAPLFALGAIFFVATWLEQSYVRYLYPAFALALAAGGRIVAAADGARGIAAFAVAVPMVGLNLWQIPAGVWWNIAICATCSFDAAARARALDRFAPQRVPVAWLNANAPQARLGWLAPRTVGPAGLIGPAWIAGSWHDYPTVVAWESIENADDLATLARARHTDYFMVPLRDGDSDFEAIVGQFRDRYLTPVLYSNHVILARWADVPMRRLWTLPADYPRPSPSPHIEFAPERMIFRSKGLAGYDLNPTETSYTYRLVPACVVGTGRGIVEMIWFDDGGARIRTDTHYHACADDGRETALTLVAPPGSRTAKVFVGGAEGAPFTLASFTLSAR